MSGREVQAPDGRRWIVRRRWAPRLRDQTIWARIRSRYKKIVHRTGEGADLPDPGCAGDLFDDLAIVVVIIVIVAVLFLFVVPLVMIVVDLIFLLLFTLLGLLGRIVFRRPWTIEAVCDDGDRKTWKVVGWRASAAHLENVAQHLEAGIPLPELE